MSGSVLRASAGRVASDFRVGGFVPFSTTDFPGALAAVVFSQGCPWRCRYCHNPHLQPARSASALSWSALCSILERRRGLLDAVVFSGGEPTAQAGLARAAKLVRDLGFRTGLHTAGIYPRRLEQLLGGLDWVGLDVKSTRARYPIVTGAARGAGAVDESLRLLVASGVPFEVRTTVHPQLVSADDLTTLAQWLAERGVKRYAIQEFRSQGCADPTLRLAVARPDEALCAQLRGMFEHFELRSA